MAGSVRIALHEMARLITSLQLDNGSVAIEGFNCGSTPPTANSARTRAPLLTTRPPSSDVGCSSHGEDGDTPRERVTLRPALDANGLWGGYAGNGGKTIVPCEAGAKLTVCVVKGRYPAAALEAVRQHLRQCPPTAAHSK